MIFPRFCNLQFLASLAKFWHQLGRTRRSSDKEVNSGTDKREGKVVNTKNEEQRGNFAMSIWKERDGYAYPTKMKGYNLPQRNEMENQGEGLYYWNTIYYATDIS